MLKAGVAGAGVFGGYHAKKLASLAGVSLAAVFDLDLARAEALAGPLGAAAYDRFEAFLEAVDTVTVATPADSHASLARLALAGGRHAYVEKPLAIVAADARALATLARNQGLTLAVGHQERVVFDAMGLTRIPERPGRLASVRRGLPSPRNRDVSCVLDLMIHDLDLGLVLGGAPVAVSARGGFDEVEAEVRFESGLEARFSASRIAAARERTMQVDYASGRVAIDFLAPAFANDAGLALDPGFADSPAGRDPLGVSVAAFLQAAQGRGAPVVDGEAGLRAVELALAVEQAAGL